MLDLGKALTIARGIGISATQMKDLTEQDKPVCGMRKNRHDRNQARTEQPRDDKTRVSECRNCGRKHETKQKCPARGKVCFKCKKPNHYSRMCRSRGFHDLQQEVNEPELEDNDFFIGAINHEGRHELLVNLVLEDSHTVKVKLDTEAPVNVMPLALYKALGKDHKKLKPTNTSLTAYGSNKIEVLGCCHLNSRYRNSVRVLEFYVVNACAPCALSLKACQDLALIKVVLAVYTENKSQTDKLLDEFKDVFIGQGCVYYAVETRSTASSACSKKGNRSHSQREN